MKALFICGMIWLQSLFVYGQQLNRDLQSLIDTELAFAQKAQAENSRDAFLQYLSDETVMFMDGGIKIGKKVWQDRRPDSSLLIWTPVFADISASGDFGYTTGPSEYYSSRRKGEEGFYGSYVTMWRRDANQQWKMALDIGVYPQPLPASKTLHTGKTVVAAPDRNGKDAAQDLIKHERIFIKDLSTGKGYGPYISSEARFLRAGFEPVTTALGIAELVKRELAKISYNPVDVVISSAGDMAYVYGRVTIGVTDKPVQGYYLRIYKKENKDWKIVLDAIHQ